MDYFLVIICAFLLTAGCARGIHSVPFDQNYYQTYGGNHLTLLEEGRVVQLLIDQYSGAGFSSKQEFGSGYFGIDLKLPAKNSTGIVTTFYLTSVPVGQPLQGNHYEFDLEFLGGNIGIPHRLSTNAFANDGGNREQIFNLWFDATADFHRYELLWNDHQIVWFVDGSPIRIWKNDGSNGVAFPIGPLHVEASSWNAKDWLGEADWAQGPFEAHYRGFSINGCPYQPLNPQECSGPIYFWNANKYWQLSPDQEIVLQNIRKNNIIYDYCGHTSNLHSECSINH